MAENDRLPRRRRGQTQLKFSRQRCGATSLAAQCHNYHNRDHNTASKLMYSMRGADNSLRVVAPAHCVLCRLQDLSHARCNVASRISLSHLPRRQLLWARCVAISKHFHDELGTGHHVGERGKEERIGRLGYMGEGIAATTRGGRGQRVEPAASTPICLEDLRICQKL